MIAGILMLVTMGALDQSIVTPALPAIARDLHGFESLSWIVAAYLLTSTALTLVYGKLSDIYGSRILMLIAVAVFAAASVLCAASQNVFEIIAARALQGAGAGGLIVTSQAAMADLVAPRERARYQVYLTMCFALASAAGPPLGGFFVDHLSWRWVFWVNVPIAAVAYVVCRQLPLARRETIRRPIDVLGLCALMAVVTLVLVATTLAGSSLAWNSLPVLGYLGLALLFGVFFVAREARAAEPMFPSRLLANATIRMGDATVFLVAMLMFGAIVLVPVFLQVIAGVSAGTSGALIVPLLVGMAVASAVSSHVMRSSGRYKGLLIAGPAIAMVAYWQLSTMTLATSTAFVTVVLAALGFGIGTFFPTISIAVQNAADARDVGTAISTVVFARSLGGAFGAAAFWSFFISSAGRYLEPSGEARFQHALAQRSGISFEAFRHGRTDLVALTHGFHDAFVAGGVIALVAVAMMLGIKDDILKSTRSAPARSGN